MPIFVPLLIAGGGALVSMGIEYGTAKATGTTPTRGEYATAGVLGAIPGTGYVRPGIKIVSTIRKTKNINKSGKVFVTGSTTVAGRRVPVIARMNQLPANMDRQTQVVYGIYHSRKPAYTIGKTATLDVTLRAGYDHLYGTPSGVGPAGGSSPTRPKTPPSSKQNKVNGSATSYRRRSNLLGVSSGKTPGRRRQKKFKTPGKGRIWCRRLKAYTTPSTCYGGRK